MKVKMLVMGVATIMGKGAPLVLMLLCGGVFNLLIGVLLYSKSAEE